MAKASASTRHEPAITHKPSIICAYSKGKLNWPVTQEAAAHCGSQFLKRVDAKACKSRSGVTVTGLPAKHQATPSSDGVTGGSFGSSLGGRLRQPPSHEVGPGLLPRPLLRGPTSGGESYICRYILIGRQIGPYE